MNAIAAGQLPACGARRGPVHERLALQVSEWREMNGYQVGMRLRGVAMGAPWLADLSHLARIGFTGRGTADWLAAEHLSIPSAPNRWLPDSSGATVARLGPQDFLITDDIGVTTGVPQSLAERWQMNAQRSGYPVPRQHGLAMFGLGGVGAPDVLARLCAVDLGPSGLAHDAIAQTHLALTAVVIMRGPQADAASYRVFVDTSLALYLWDVLHEVAATLGGGPVGAAQIPAA